MRPFVPPPVALRPGVIFLVRATQRQVPRPGRGSDKPSRQALATMPAMGTLYLVRHGQASFGADNFDLLSPLGQRQCQRLGAYFGAKGRQFAAAITGTLVRQTQSLDAISAGMGVAQEALRLPGLNEYDSAAVIAAIHPQPLARPDTPELYRHHFRLLRNGLTAWMAGKTQPQGMPSYADFVAGVAGALAHVRAHCNGDVLMVSSGGPISTAVGQILGTAPEVTIELNMRIRNSAVTEFNFNPKRHTLVTYNTLPHLDADAYADWVTYT
jgi:broad specificity phosphatase PhoE